MFQKVGGLVISVIAAFCTSCTISPPEPPHRPVALAKIYQCFAMPSGAYQAGGILRTFLPSEEVEDDMNQTTLDFSPLPDSALEYDYPDSTATVGGNAGLTFDANELTNGGFTGSLSASAEYTLKLDMRDNKHFVATADSYDEAVRALERSKNLLLEGYNYYFIKESIASRSLSYSATTDAGADIKLSRGDSDMLSVSPGRVAASSSIESKGPLLHACVMPQKLDFDTIFKGNGTPEIQVVSREEVSTLSPEEIRYLIN